MHSSLPRNVFPLSPSAELMRQVTMYWDWPEVHKADKYLDRLEQLVNATFEECVFTLSGKGCGAHILGGQRI
jgi:hypothetical protein